MMFGIVTDVATFFFSENVIDLVTLIRAVSFQLSVTDESLEVFHHNFPVNHN